MNIFNLQLPEQCPYCKKDLIEDSILSKNFVSKENIFSVMSYSLICACNFAIRFYSHDRINCYALEVRLLNGNVFQWGEDKSYLLLFDKSSNSFTDYIDYDKNLIPFDDEYFVRPQKLETLLMLL